MKKPITHKRTVSLDLPRNVYALLGIARAIVHAMDANKTFPTPDPSLAVITTAADELEAAQNVVRSGAKNAVANRDAKAAALVTLLEQEKAYVQKVANAADPAHAADVIQSAAMNVKHVPTRAPRVFGATLGPVSGSAKLMTRSAGPRAAYEWEYSVDGGKTWQAAPPTLQARTLVTGLQPGVAHAFRYRSVTKAGPSDWSEPTTLLVH